MYSSTWYSRDETKGIFRVYEAAFSFIDASHFTSAYEVLEEVNAYGFDISSDELESIVEGHGNEGISENLSTSIIYEIRVDEESLKRRQNICGFNKSMEIRFVKLFYNGEATNG